MTLVTVTFSGSVSAAGAVAVEYSGLDQVNPLDSVSAASSQSAGLLLDSGFAALSSTTVVAFGGGLTDSNYTPTVGNNFVSVRATSGTTSPGALTEEYIVANNATMPPSTLPVQAATAGTPGSLSAGNWIMQMAAFRAATSAVTGGWSPTRPVQAVNTAQYPGSDICLQASNAQAGLTGVDFVMPVVGGGTSSPVACTAVPATGQAAGTITAAGNVVKITSVGTSNSASNVVLSISNPIELGPRTVLDADPLGGSNNGIMLQANSTFKALAANRLWTNSGGTFSISQEGGTAGCYRLTYASLLVDYHYVIRGTEPMVTLSGFTVQAALNGNFRVVAGNGNGGGNTWGDPFCVVSGSNYAAGPTTNSFVFFDPAAAAAGFTTCGTPSPSCGSTAQVQAYTYMLYLGNAPTDSVGAGTCGSGTSDQYCALGLLGQNSAYSGPAAGAVIRNIGFLTVDTAPGIGGIACIYCQEGSGMLNDSTVIFTVPGPDVAKWSAGLNSGNPNFGSAGNSPQNAYTFRGIEDYCNNTFSCKSASNGYHVAVILNDTWDREGLDNITANYAPTTPVTPAVWINGQSAPTKNNAGSGASGPEVLGHLNCQSYEECLLVGDQEPTKDVDVASLRINAGNSQYAAVISCNFNGGNTCAATGVTTPAGDGNMTSDIGIHNVNGGGMNATIWDQFENTGSLASCPTSGGSWHTTPGCWTDTAILDWEMHNCISGDSACTGPGISIITTSSQFPNRLAGGLGLGAGSHLGNTASNKDFTGTCTLPTACVITFAVPYASTPVCVASDTSAINAVRVLASTTGVTFNGTSGDVIAYACFGNPN